MSHLRSETMQLFQLTVPKDDAWSVANILGSTSTAHFIDLNKNEQPFDLPYTSRIKMCDDTERRLNFLITECKENRIRVNKPHDQENFEELIKVVKQQRNVAMDLLFDNLDAEIQNLEQFVSQQSKSLKDMHDGLNRKRDFLKVLEFCQTMVPQLGAGAVSAKAVNPEDPDAIEAPLVSTGGLTFVAGTILAKQEEYMRRILFRVTRGKALTHFQSYEQEGETEVKSTYMVVYQESAFMNERVQKICDSFQAGQRFNIPPIDQIAAQIVSTRDEILNDESVLLNSRIALKSYLRKINQLEPEKDAKKAVNTLQVYKWFIAKEKSIYNALNMMRAGQQTYIGYFWAPTYKVGALQETMRTEYPTTELKEVENSYKIKEPTCFVSNEVTVVYQMITDTYGVPSYKEANPSVFNIITFPFLFGVMFGDYGHGSIIWFVGTLLILGEPWLRHNEIGKQIVPFRYFAFLMGMFSCWNGLLYNEYFAIPNDWFGTCYDVNENVRDSYDLNNGGTYNNTNFESCNYAFGVDPSWFLAENYLEFIDNVKMKTSVIIAVFHMSMGIVIKGSNAIHFSRWMVLVFEVFTGFIILFGLFGWMDVLIFSKWFYVMDPDSFVPNMQAKINTCPSVITVMIDNFLKLGTGMNPGPYWFNTQNEISAIMIVCAVICMPLMLCVKPIAYSTCLKEDEIVNIESEFDDRNEEEKAAMLEAEKAKQILNASHESSNAVDNAAVIGEILAKEGDGDHAHGFGEMMIHQMIETIEFVLGTVSNTASYLRLWALSLAHSELALVFLTEILIIPWKPTETQFPGMDSDPTYDGPIVQTYPSVLSLAFSTWILWFPFMTFTYFVLLNMDVLECSLHTLRLHWVEFQNKFFQGTGYAYTPFSFKAVFEKEMSK